MEQTGSVRNQVGIITCGWHEGEEDLPEKRQEVEDVIATGRHFLFISALFIVVVFIHFHDKSKWKTKKKKERKTETKLAIK